MSGAGSYRSGLAAEEQVVAHYLACGHALAARRWRGESGEIDIVLRGSDGLVFVEVKSARDVARAAERVTARQLGRVARAATEFAAGEAAGLDTPMRFDVALVGASGEMDILSNVTLH